MPSLETSIQCKVTIEGTEIERNLATVQLDQYIDDHHELTVTIRQPDEGDLDPTFLDADKASGFLGKPVSVAVTPTGGAIDDSRVLSFVGVVTKVDFINSIDGLNTIVLQAASPTILLDGARKDRFWEEQSDSDIVNAILRNYEITVGNVESTSGAHPYVVQHNQTDMEFLRARAAIAGLFAYYDGMKFHLGTPDNSDQEELVFRNSLGMFSVGLGVGQAEYAATVYNPHQDRVYSQSSKAVRSSKSVGGLLKTSPEATKNMYPEASVTPFSLPVESASDLDKVLDKERSRALDRMIECYGESIVPSVKAGHCVKISGVGDKLEGVYYVSSVSHSIDETGYTNSFICRPLDLAFPQTPPQPEPHTKIQRAEVIDNDDPEKLARVKVKFPWLPDSETPWIRTMAIHAGQDHGWYVIPEIGDEVMVAFEHGNANQPIVLGSLYNATNKPPADGPDGDNNFKLFSTRSGAQIKISDESGSEAISLVTGDGKNQIVLDSSGPAITIKSDGDIAIEGASIKLKAQQAVDIESGSPMTLKSNANVDVEAGANLKVKSNGMLDVNSSAILTIKGSLVKIN